jgi:uncharacterized protein (TIGR02231 family)
MRTNRGSLGTLGAPLPCLLVSLGSIVAGCGPALLPAARPTRPSAAKLTPPTALEVADAGTDAGTLESRVTKVTVYSDSARITREAGVELSTEPRVFAFRRLPGWVDDGSVQVSVSEGAIVDVRVDRDFLARATDADWERVEAEHRTLGERKAALEDELQVLDTRKKQIESIQPFSTEKISRDTILGEVHVESYAEVLRFVTDSLRETAKATRAVKSALAEVAPEYEASLRRLEAMKSVRELEETTVLVTLQASEATPAEVELTYMLPGVTWEPMHELRVRTADSKSVDVVSFAEVTQTSGEDWVDAELSFSTQSSTQLVQIPELEALTLGDTHDATEILTTRVSSFGRAQQAFEGQSEAWTQYLSATAKRARASFEQVQESNVEYLKVVQSKTVRLFESLQKRGTTAHFVAQGPTSVRGDGRPVRVEIGRATLASSQKIVAAPEQSLNAAHTLGLLNTTGQPLLPGRVALYRDGTFLGMTDVDFIAKGERFSLFLAVADHLKLSRELDRTLSSLVRDKRTRMKVAFVVTVENLSSEPTSLTLADRIPVSENREIEVKRVKIAPAARPDGRGILSWDLHLGAMEKQQLRISYEIEYPPELILETVRRRSMAEPSAMPASPMHFEDSGIEDQIMTLEENF